MKSCGALKLWYGYIGSYDTSNGVFSCYFRKQAFSPVLDVLLPFIKHDLQSILTLNDDIQR